MSNNESYRSLNAYSDLICKTQFGKQPDSIEIRANDRCCLIFYRGLVDPGDSRLPDDPDERYSHVYILLEQFIFPALTPKIEALSGRRVEYAFMDWKVENNTSMIAAFLVPLDEPMPEDLYNGKAQLHSDIESITEKVQKTPVKIESFRLDDDILMIIRKGLLISLEKKLVKKGFNTQLRIAKRELELDRFIEGIPIRDLVGRDLETAYIDWSFKDDVSLLLLKLSEEIVQEPKVSAE
ncbi:hypothetical protein CDO73_16845 [Saccharibacillus sp. O23]|uniref:Na-translocating system protein MpsC family protein n=1 Tax=Saccharibacillus sp. O23 TaxID=2009338 RepID=UPI000B4E14EF|nr:Na-translocating system protein MpsC family protein [Saccharibacillus sp. O23]OWR28880.1 hypothetical protein CDO73_16845 [Saccharibacillus sp. O23]